MKEILILTGACGVGKTTISKAWAKKKKGAAIDCDFLTEWIYDPDFPHRSREEEKFVAHLSTRMALDYFGMGMSVAIENVWSPYGIKIIKNELQDIFGLKIKFIYIHCLPEENHRRDLTRPVEDQMKERVDVVAKELASYNWPDYVHKLDTSRLTVDESINEIDRIYL